MKLRTKFIALLVPLVVAPLAFIGNVAYTQLRLSAEQRVFDQVDARLGRLTEDVHLTRQQVAASSRMFSHSDELALFQAGQNGPINALVRQYADSYDDFTSFRVVTTDGSVRLLHNGRGMITDGAQTLSDQERESLLGVDGGTLLQVDKSDGSLVIEASAPIADESNNVLGFVVLARRLPQVTRAITSDKLGDRGFLMLATESGDLIAAHRELAPAALPSGTAFDSWRQAPLATRSLSLRLDDTQHFVNGVRFQDGLLLFAVQPTEQVVASTRKFGVTMALVTLFAVFLTVATLLLALHHVVVHPIKLIQRAANAIREGDLSARPNVNSNDEIGALALSFDEMSASLRDSNDHVQYLAYHDSLTGLPNRSHFRDQLQDAIMEARIQQQRLAILFLDLDDFKRINDTLGHQVGDEILHRFSQSITQELRESYAFSMSAGLDRDFVIGRLGGDEFVILLRNVADEYGPRNIARRLIDLMSQPLQIRGHELYISSSIGIALYPADADSADDLIKNADAAMYHAKEQGKDNYQYYSQSMNEAATRRLLMESRLRKALDKGQFELFYQPKVNPQTLEIIGAEALLRWNDPELGLVQPGDFVGIAEDTGLILPIGEWVLETACQQLAEWQSKDFPEISLSVNVSAIQVSRQDLSFVVARALRQSGVPPHLLDVEITESALMSGGEKAVQMLTELKDLDVSVSLDDFGTGYSSLSYLRRFPVNNLKIDRSFVSEINERDNSRSIVAAMIAMSRSLDMTVTAEGVEDDSQLEFLRHHDCDFVQGYLISKPVPAEDFERLLLAGEWRSGKRREAKRPESKEG